ncbi:MAG: hypothetical protein ACR2HC_09765 [Thermoleophilaceae bacterium]
MSEDRFARVFGTRRGSLPRPPTLHAITEGLLNGRLRGGAELADYVRKEGGAATIMGSWRTENKGLFVYWELKLPPSLERAALLIEWDADVNICGVRSLLPDRQCP